MMVRDRKFVSVSLAAGASLLLAASFAGPLAADPNSDLRGLNNRLEKIEQDMLDLQRQTYRGGSGSGASSSAYSSDPASAGDVTLRLQDIETSLREMNGRIEKLSFDIRQTKEQLSRFMEDVEFRFQELEGGRGGQASAGAQAGGQVRLTPPDGDGAGAGNTGAPAQGPRSLGTLSQSADPVAGAAASGAGAAAGAAAGGQDESGEAGGEGPVQTASAVIGATSPKDAYDASIDLLKRGEFEAARVNFDKFLELYPNDQLAGNAQYWLGETYYVRGDYKQAADAFLKGYTTYEASPKAPDSLLKLGITLSALGQKEAACATMNELKRRFPSASQSVIQRAELEKQRAGC